MVVSYVKDVTCGRRVFKESAGDFDFGSVRNVNGRVVTTCRVGTYVERTARNVYGRTEVCPNANVAGRARTAVVVTTDNVYGGIITFDINSDSGSPPLNFGDGYVAVEVGVAAGKGKTLGGIDVALNSLDFVVEDAGFALILVACRAGKFDYYVYVGNVRAYRKGIPRGNGGSVVFGAVKGEFETCEKSVVLLAGDYGAVFDGNGAVVFNRNRERNFVHRNDIVEFKRVGLVIKVYRAGKHFRICFVRCYGCGEFDFAGFNRNIGFRFAGEQRERRTRDYAYAKHNRE